MKTERKGEHVHARIFVGPDLDHLALSGTLVFRLDEWLQFGAALCTGADVMELGPKWVEPRRDGMALAAKLSGLSVHGGEKYLTVFLEDGSEGQS